MSEVVAVGQFPPPVSGFSHITNQMVVELRRRHQVTALDIAGKRGAGGAVKHFSRIAATLKACGGLVRGRRSGAICYIACEGGLGLVYTLVLVGLARLLGYRTFLHHHSFTYIDTFKPLMRLVLAIGGPVEHVFLCEIMRRQFEERYRRKLSANVVSNAAFVPPIGHTPTADLGRPLVLGHLSNLTREKGLYLFLDVLRQAVAEGRAVRGILAGPVAVEADQRAIEAVRTELGERFEYRGALYGADKDGFYRDTDVFVFPTEYANEAQPTVLFEALAAGCKIVSFERGCIANQVLGDGLIIPKGGDFVTAALTWIDAHGSAAQADRAATAERYRVTHATALDTARRLLDLKRRSAA